MPIEFIKLSAAERDARLAWRQDQLVGDALWCDLIPLAHQALSNPVETSWFPEYRHVPEDQHLYTAFWETALYIMHTLLGWTDPGRGLQWWHAQGFDAQDDDRLQLLRDVWVGHPHFDAFAAWCWQRGTSYGCRGAFWHLVGKLAARQGVRGSQRRGESFLGGDWWRSAQQNEGVVSGPFFDTSSENLHLGHSMQFDGSEALRGEVLCTRPSERRAVLMLPYASGWYRQLLLHGRRLPDLGARSWHVEVVVKPLGHLGTFRRSRDTGMWFQGRHITHMVGQVTRDEIQPTSL